MEPVPQLSMPIAFAACTFTSAGFQVTTVRPTTTGISIAIATEDRFCQTNPFSPRPALRPRENKPNLWSGHCSTVPHRFKGGNSAGLRRPNQISGVLATYVE